ncbi:MAG TPA: RICIN domain-containing protein [Verrucomicrobiae bacterium]|jgi:signal transduction histidine kinase
MHFIPPQSARWLRNGWMILGVLLAWLVPMRVSAHAVNGLYVGTDFYAPSPAIQDAARASGFTRLFLSFFHVETNGDLTYNGTPVVRNGVFVGDASWEKKLARIKTPPTSVDRIELSIGGEGDASFANLKHLIAVSGTNSDSVLYKNFSALKDATGADAIQIMDEETYDLPSATLFGQMIANLGMKVSLGPFNNQKFWVALKTQLGSRVDAIYLQCYGRGTNNDPGLWNQALGGFEVYPGLWGNTDTPTSAMMKMRKWQQGLGISGGFIWLNGFMPGDSVKWASALSYGLNSIPCLRIINRNSGKAMALLGTNITNGSIISQASPKADDTQRWMLVPTDDAGHFKLVSWTSGLCASITYNSSLGGAQLWAWDYNHDPSQQFELVDTGNGWFKIKNVRSGLMLEVAGGSVANEAAVQQNIDTGVANQQWKFYPYDSTVLAYDNFDYPAGYLSGQNGGEGWNGGWLDVLNPGTKVITGSLTDASRASVLHTVTASGNSVFIPNAKRVGRYLDCSISGIFSAYGYLNPNGRIGADGTTLYLSFFQQPEKLVLFYEFELNRSLDRIAGIGNDTHTTSVNLRAPGTAFTPIGLGDTNVNFYVLRIDFKPGNDDVRIYRNPDPVTEPNQPTLAMKNVADMSFNRLSLAAFANSNTVKFGQIRVASSWPDAVSAASEHTIQFSNNFTADDIFKQVNVSAQVLQGSGQMYYLLEGDTGLRIKLNRPMSFEPGDMVALSGLVEQRNQFVDLIEVTAQKTGHQPLPSAKPFDVSNLQQQLPWGWLEGVITGLEDNGTEQILQIQAGPQKIMALVHSDHRDSTSWPLGSRLKLTGILIRHDANVADAENENAFEMLLDSPAAVEIIAKPPWWTLKRAMIAVSSLIAILMFAFIWISLLHRQVDRRTIQWKSEISKREKIEQDRIITEERSRIARDLHDDLGSKLTQINMLAWLPGELTKSENLRERLQLVGEKSLGMITALDEVVWMMNPKSETLSSFAAYLAGYTEEFLSKTGIDCRVEAPGSYPARVITSEMRNHLFSSVKEVLNNAVRHGKPSRISLKFAVSENDFVICVHDNGSGFDPAQISPGNGLANLQERMRKMKGQCQIQSSAKTGTQVTLQAPLV